MVRRRHTHHGTVAGHPPWYRSGTPTMVPAYTHHGTGIYHPVYTHHTTLGIPHPACTPLGTPSPAVSLPEREALGSDLRLITKKEASVRLNLLKVLTVVRRLMRRVAPLLREEKTERLDRRRVSQPQT